MFFCDAILGSKAEIRTDVEQNLVALQLFPASYNVLCFSMRVDDK